MSSRKSLGLCKSSGQAKTSPISDCSTVRSNPDDFSDGDLQSSSDLVHIPRTKENMDELRRALVRRQMVDIIEERLHGDDTVSKKCLAEALERHLHNRAPAFEEYADVSTLDARLRRLTEALVKHRLQKKQGLRSEPSVQTSMQDALGEQRYREVQELVDEVHRLRLSRCSSCCANKMGSCPRDVPPGLRAQRVMPLPIRDLFFRTTLLDSISTTPTERIPYVDWDALIRQTQKVVQAYKEWLQAQPSLESPLPDYSEV